jgi:4-hydroxy-tetrahydrodipicolinate synthase
MKPFTGTGVALVTPFLQDFSIDFPALERLTEFVISSGVDFLVPLGTTGESVTLNQEEQDACLSTILKVNNNRLPVLLGCGGNNTHSVLSRMHYFSDRFEFQGFLSVCPYYNKPTQSGIINHFSMLAESSSKPLMLYNVPGRTVVNMTAETTLFLAKQYSRKIIGIKEASGNLQQGMSILKDCPKEFIVLSGDDDLVLPQIACGYQGVISVAANVIPATFSTMVRECMLQHFESSRTTAIELLPFIQHLFAEGNPAGVKAGLAHIQICDSTVRPPLVEASKGLSETLSAFLDRFKG